MFKLQRYNCEGFANLFTYDFNIGVYVLHGDFNNNLINSFYNGIENIQGAVFFKDQQIDSVIDFGKNEAGIIFENNNFISYLTFKENLSFYRKVKKEKDVYDYNYDEVFKYLDLDSSLYTKKVINNTYFEEIKLAIAKSILSNDNVIFISLSKNEELHQENTELINILVKLNVKIKKIFIISDIGRHYNSRNVIFLKYFHGFISEKIMED